MQLSRFPTLSEPQLACEQTGQPIQARASVIPQVAVLCLIVPIESGTNARRNPNSRVN
jgi:hypothetical protein